VECGEVYAKWGKKEEALNEIEDLSKKVYSSPLDRAGIYALLGEKDRAFEWLERGYQERSVRLQYLKTMRPYDSLRDDPRYKDLLQRVGLPQ
jgi:hypothetical protein